MTDKTDWSERRPLFSYPSYLSYPSHLSYPSYLSYPSCRPRLLAPVT